MKAERSPEASNLGAEKHAGNVSTAILTDTTANTADNAAAVFYPPISPELRDAIRSAFAGFTPSDHEVDE